MSNGENVNKRLANLETRFAELTVKLSGLADMHELQHQRLLRLEAAVRDALKPKTLASRFPRFWSTQP